ncbi:MAG: GatB/YqeY domain-containing protein [Candidatus Aquicultorales bacterium]
MSLKEQLSNDMKAAMRSGDKLRLSTIRLLISEIKNAEIAKGEGLADEEVVELVQRQVKRRREAVEQYEKGGRAELAEKETSEAKILESYLPSQLGDEELEEIVKAAIRETGASSKKEMGKVMGAVMPKVKGKAEGTRVSKTVASLLPE